MESTSRQIAVRVLEQQMSSLSPAQKEAWRSFLRAQSRLARRCDRAMVAAGHVSLDTYDVLVTLEYADGHRLRMSDLAEQVLLSRSGITRLVDRLAAKGWIRREACDQDKRCAWAQLTAEGQKVREAAWAVFERELAQTWGQSVNDDKAAELQAFFDRLA